MWGLNSNKGFDLGLIEKKWKLFKARSQIKDLKWGVKTKEINAWDEAGNKRLMRYARHATPGWILNCQERLWVCDYESDRVSCCEHLIQKEKEKLCECVKCVWFWLQDWSLFVCTVNRACFGWFCCCPVFLF